VLAAIAIREHAELCANGEPSHAHQPPDPPSPRGHAIPDLCLTPKVLGQRPQTRPRAWAGVLL
jgi:hypothetical protein